MPHHPQINLLAKKLFFTFARTEYALKAAGYNNGDGEAKANWSKFAIAIDELVINTTDLKLRTAINFLFSSPPKKQIIRNGVIQWETSIPTNPSTADNLLVYVRRVRNNLFHGGKFSDHWFDPERTGLLLDNCIAVLEACVSLEPSVHERYLGSMLT